jgi:hypothetical protein
MGLCIDGDGPEAKEKITWRMDDVERWSCRMRDAGAVACAKWENTKRWRKEEGQEQEEVKCG